MVGVIRNWNRPAYYDSTLYDVIVYGSTPSGIMAVQAAAKLGGKVALVTQDAYLGGMMSSGLCATDKGAYQDIGGLTGSLFASIAAYYNTNDPHYRYNFEPRVIEPMFNDLASKYAALVVKNSPLSSAADVVMSGKKIVSINTTAGVLRAKQFVDASYEGDLLRFSGAAYFVGREGNAAYGESFNGYQPGTPQAGYTLRDGGGNLYYPATESPGLNAGDPDLGVMAFNYRCVATRVAGNMLPWVAPAGYDPTLYELVRQSIVISNSQTFLDVIGAYADVPTGPNSLTGKYNTNSNGFVSTDLPKRSWGYPLGSQAQRAAIVAEHKLWQQGLFYWLATDPSVPASIRADMLTWGLAADEFTSNAGWPYSVYVRQSIRGRGAYVMSEADVVATGNTKSSAVFKWQYDIDTHAAQLVPGDTPGTLMREGIMFVHYIDRTIPLTVRPYEIPLACLHPAVGDVSNLWYSCCASGTYSWYATYRLEPPYMMAGEACGAGAMIAAAYNTTDQSLNVASVQQALDSWGAIR